MRYALFSTLETKFISYEHIKELYEHDLDFASKYYDCVQTAQNGYFMHNDYLFKEKRLCVPKGSIRKLLVKDAHERGINGAFWCSKDFRLAA